MMDTDRPRENGLMEPIEPPPTRWRLPDPDLSDDDGIAGVGADLEPGTLLAAYRLGLFPMPLGRRSVAWFSPDPRAVLPLDRLHVSRSLRRSEREMRSPSRGRTARGSGENHATLRRPSGIGKSPNR